MPKFTYKPEGADPKVWSVSFGRFMSSERIMIERNTGLPWSEIKGRLFAEDTLVIRAFLYVLLKRDMPTLKIESVEFCEEDIDLDATPEERAQAIEIYEAKAAAGELDEDRAEALAELLREQAEDPDAPKAPTPPSMSSSDGDT